VNQDDGNLVGIVRLQENQAGLHSFGAKQKTQAVEETGPCGTGRVQSRRKIHRDGKIASCHPHRGNARGIGKADFEGIVYGLLWEGQDSDGNMESGAGGVFASGSNVSYGWQTQPGPVQSGRDVA
jgi:hypothetical protein